MIRVFRDESPRAAAEFYCWLLEHSMFLLVFGQLVLNFGGLLRCHDIKLNVDGFVAKNAYQGVEVEFVQVVSHMVFYKSPVLTFDDRVGTEWTIFRSENQHVYQEEQTGFRKGYSTIDQIVY